MAIPEIHLKTSGPVTRDSDKTRAFPLNEAGAPKGDGTPASLVKIIDYLDVEKRARYRRTTSSTFCNIYAYDYAYLAGAYVPRVFWTEAAIKSGDTAKAVYAKNVTEMNANALYDWFAKYGPQFGWVEVDFNRAQAEANAGKCVIMVAAHKDRSRSGHIVAVVPENGARKAVASSGLSAGRTIVYPLQSQAGAVNKKYFAEKWWNGHEPVRVYVSLK